MKKQDSGVPLFHVMTCRKCSNRNPIVFFAPVNQGNQHSTVICLECAVQLGFATPQGDLKEGIEL